MHGIFTKLRQEESLFKIENSDTKNHRCDNAIHGIMSTEDPPRQNTAVSPPVLS